MKKLNKQQRRVARKVLFPLVALVMMTATMALAGTGHAPTPAAATR